MKSQDHNTSLITSALANGIELVHTAAIVALRPPPMMTVSEWAQQHRRLSSKSASEYGDWHNERTPYLVAIMDALSPQDPCDEVVFMKGTQLGGTEVGLNWLGFVIDQAPGPAMMVRPTSQEAKRFSKQRLASMIESTPCLRRRVRDARSRDSGNTTLLKDFDGGILALAGANSETELSSMPARYLFEDETDKYPDALDKGGDPETIAEVRTDTYGSRKKKFFCSSPGRKSTSRIARRYEASDQRQYYVPCPHCEQKQVLIWEQMRWQTLKTPEYLCTHCGAVSDGSAVTGETHPCPDCKQTGAVNDVTLIERDTGDVIDVWYECISCNQRISEHQKTTFLAGGEWVAENPGPGRAKGFHLSGLYSPVGMLAWAECVKRWLNAQQDPELMQVFVNTVLGLPYDERDEDQPDEHTLREREEPYRLRTVPEHALVLVASVDVQGDRLEAKLKAYGPGEESWLIDIQKFYGNPESLDATGGPWQQLTDWRRRKYPHALGGELTVMACAVDSGYLTDSVYEYCRRHKSESVFPVKGVDGRGKPLIGKSSEQDVTYNGRTVKGGIQLFNIGVDTGKDMVYIRMRIEPGQQKAMHFPVGLPDEYYKQLTAEERINVRLRSGHTKPKWQKKPGARNEAFDLEVYNLAAAHRLGVHRMTPEKWDILKQKLIQVALPLDSGEALPTPARGAAADLQQQSKQRRVRGRVAA